jgi:hypothetical protein
MANKFTLTITAVDKATAVVRGVNQSVAKMASPVTNLKSSFKSLGKEIGQNPIAKVFQTGAKGAGKMLGAVGKLVPELGGIGEMMGPIAGVAGAFGLVGASVGAVIAAVVAADMKFASFGFNLKQTSLSLGMTTQQAQAWHGASEVMGVDNKTVDSSFQQLGDTIQDATYGRNQQALMFMNRLGITLKRTKTGAVDVSDEMLQLSDVIHKYNGNPETQRLIARQFGVEGMLPALRGGRKELEGYLKAQKKYAISDKEVNDAEKFTMGVNKLKTSLKGFAYRGMAGVFEFTTHMFDWMPGWGAGIQSFLTGLWDGITGMFAGGIATLKGLLEGAKALVDKTVNGVKSLPGRVGEAAKKSGAAVRGWFAQEGDQLANVFHIKRNNPGNIRPLNGQGFNTYATLSQGLAAMGRQLQIYQDKHNLSTIRGIVSRWAPPGDHNDTAAYIRNVAARTGFGADQGLNLHDPRVLAALERAMIKQEHGADISQNAILAAIGGGAPGANGVRTGGGSVDVNVKVQHDGRSATVKTASSGAVKTAPPRVERSLNAVPA